MLDKRRIKSMLNLAVLLGYCVKAGQELHASDVFENADKMCDDSNVEFPTVIGYSINEETLVDFNLEYSLIATSDVSDTLLVGGFIEYYGVDISEWTTNETEL